MQIHIVDTFEWGHLVPKVDKGVLALALENAEENLTPNIPSEVIIYQTTDVDFY